MANSRGINPPPPDQPAVTGIVTLISPTGAITSQKLDFPTMENCAAAGSTLIDPNFKSFAREVDCIDVQGRKMDVIKPTNSGSRTTELKF